LKNQRPKKLLLNGTGTLYGENVPNVKINAKLLNSEGEAKTTKWTTK